MIERLLVRVRAKVAAAIQRWADWANDHRVPTAEPSQPETQGNSWSDPFDWVRWNGEVHTFSTSQSECVKVLISAYPDREFHRQGLEAGAVAFLDKKDLDAATLSQIIENVAANA